MHIYKPLKSFVGEHQKNTRKSKKMPVKHQHKLDYFAEYKDINTDDSKRSVEKQKI